MWIFKEHLQKLISHQKELHCPLLQKDTITKQFLYIEHVYITKSFLKHIGLHYSKKRALMFFSEAFLSLSSFIWHVIVKLVRKPFYPQTAFFSWEASQSYSCKIRTYLTMTMKILVMGWTIFKVRYYIVWNKK